MNSTLLKTPFAAQFDDRQRKRGRIFAYASTWFGCYAEVMIDSSAIIILYITMLHGNATLTMLSTALTAVAAIVFTSMIIGAGMLAPQWSKWGMNFCSYQTLFLFFAALQTFFLLMLFLVPSIMPKNNDYYMPE